MTAHDEARRSTLRRLYDLRHAAVGREGGQDVDAARGLTQAIAALSVEPRNESGVLPFRDIAALPSEAGRLRQFIARLEEIERAESTAAYRTERQRRRGELLRRDVTQRKRELLARLAAAEERERKAALEECDR